jgi:hypothetical protein
MLMAVRVTDYGGRRCDGRAVALWVGDCLRRLSPMKKRPPRRPFITRIQTNILGEKVLSSIASAFPIFFAGLLAISILPLMPIAFSFKALSSIAFATAVAAIVVLTVAAVLP